MVTKPKISKEGSGGARLFGLMQAVGYNPGGTLKIATITSENPISIILDGDTIDTPDPFIVCNPQLLPYTETVRINGQVATIEYENKLKVGVRVLVFEAEHQQQLYVLSLSDE